MKILGLDISTKTGYAIITDGKLAERGLLKADAVSTYALEDLNFCARAMSVINQVIALIQQYKPDAVFIEQTNSGLYRGSQKQLEFLHCLLMTEIISRFVSFNTSVVIAPENVFYVDTSKWRSVLKIRLSKEQREHNKKVRAKKARGKITAKHLAVSWANSTYSLSLKQKDNDIADAICIAHFGFNAKSGILTNNHVSVDDALLKYKDNP